VLDPNVDPYRQDTPAGHRDGAWLAEQMARLNITRPIHLRGLHYALVSSVGLFKPNGEPYRNNADDWGWLQVDAGKAARWLGYVPFDMIVDERNSPPIVVEHALHDPQATVGLGSTIEVTVPDVDDIRPVAYLSNFRARQKHRLVLFGEKQSIAEVAAPLCKRYGADLYLPSGELTDSQLFLMAKTGAEDGRPMIVLTVADFDPGGRQMSVSIGRKLQAFKTLLFPELEFEVVPIALAEEQVRALGLPSTPLKDTEWRGDRWRAEFGGLEQTEIDALATLKPRELDKIIANAFDHYFDHWLEGRARAVAADWEAEAQEVLDQSVDDSLIAELHAEAQSKIAGIQHEIDLINDQLRTATDTLGIEFPPLPESPEPELEGGGLPPIISTSWSWVDQTRSLIARKSYGAGEGRP
jgi:hypothetical protein